MVSGLSSGWCQGNNGRKGNGQVGAMSGNTSLLGACEGSGKAVVYVDGQKVMGGGSMGVCWRWH